MELNPRKQGRRRLLGWAAQVWFFAASRSAVRGPIVDPAPWVGTLIGSSLIAGSPANTVRFWLGVSFAAAGIFPVLAGGYWAQRLEAREDLYEARERKVLKRVALFIRRAADVAEMPRAARVKALDDVVSDLIDHLLTTVFAGTAGVRSVVYKVSNDQNSLEVLQWSGRSDAPRSFKRGDTRGNLAFEGLEELSSDHVFIPDINESLSGWGGSGRGYRTFISAPIRSESAAYGMITLDAPRPGDLDSRDGDLVETIASVLSIFFAEAARGRQGR